MIAWNCKYTPVELLGALGAEPMFLNSGAEDFGYAESVAHSSICCHVQAFLQNCHDMNLREAVLVNCCDSMRSAYGILKNSGDLDFIFLLDLPHKVGGCSQDILKKELIRLVEEYGRYKNTTFDAAKFRAAFPVASNPLPQENFIAVAGGRVSDSLLAEISARLPLPVADLTCAGTRMLGTPPQQLIDFDALMDWYADELLSLTPCMRMRDVCARRGLFNLPGLSGIVYNTVKFCDYYAFEYDSLRKQTNLPLLKIEADYLPVTGGQLSTRLGAFAEHAAFVQQAAAKKKNLGGGYVAADCQKNSQRAEKRARLGVDAHGDAGVLKIRRGDVGGRNDVSRSLSTCGGYVAGIDSGSTTTNMVVLAADGGYLAGVTVRTGPRAAVGAAKALAAVKEKLGISREQIDYLVATGYGRNAVPDADQAVTEITCHARGARYINGGVRTVIDIGGQDSKVIGLADDGSVRTFVMNDKCAAGTGRFLELMATTLEMDIAEMSKVGLDWQEDLTISSVCTVFAESEVVSLIADNRTEADIIHGLNKAVALKTSSLAGRAGGIPAYMITGGVARNTGVVQELEKKLGQKLIIPSEPELCGALGAALMALDNVK